MEGRIKRRHTRKPSQTINDQDHISKLPEQLLIYILSFLQMHDVVKTSVLSKSWVNLWTNVYNIDIRRRVQIAHVESRSYRDERMLWRSSNDRWISSVHNTLVKCNENIDKFCLIGDKFRLVGHCDPTTIIDDWIRHVVDNKVKIIKLTRSCIAPDCIFKSSTLTQMELVQISRLGYDMSSCPVSMSLLNSLLLDDVPVDHEFLHKVLMGYPVLECLVLCNVCAIHEVKIMSPSLKRFELCNFENLDEQYENGSLTINAPWLQELEISGYIFITQCELVDVSSLKIATLTFTTHFAAVYPTDDLENNNRWFSMLSKVLSSVSYVKELIIGSEQIQALQLCKVLGTPSPLFKCKNVSFETCLWKYDLPGIACLLENAPSLETMLMEVLDYWKHEGPVHQAKMLFQDGDPHLGMPNGKFMHLKNVRIDYWPRRSCHDCTYTRRGESLGFELVKYIMRSAVVLDKLVLCSSRSKCGFQCVRHLFCKIRTFLRVKKPGEWDIKNGSNMLEFTFQKNAPLLPTSSSP